MNQVFMLGEANPVSTTTTEYVSLGGMQNNNWNSNVNARKQLGAGNGYFHSLRVSLDAAPGNGGSYTFTLFLNGSSTGLTVTITDTDTTAFDGNSEVTTTASTDLSLQCVPSSSPAPTNTPKVYWCVQYQDTDSVENFMIIGGRNNNLNTTTTEYNYMSSGDLWRTEVAVFPPNNSRQEISRSGTLKNLYVKLAGDPSPGSYALSVKRGTSKITATVNSGSTTANNTSTTIAASANQDFNIESIPASSPTSRNGRWSCLFASSDPYEHPVFGGARNPLNLSSAEYNFIWASNTNWVSTIAERQSLAGCVTLSKLYIELNQINPMDNFEFVIMKNSVATALAVNLDNTQSRNNNTNTFVDFAPGDLVTLRATPTGATPGGVNLRAFWGFSCRTIAPFPNSQMMMGYGI